MGEDDLKKYEPAPQEQKKKIPASFLILGGGSILTMAGAVLYTIFFYLSLPNHHELDQSDQSIRHVPLPVPPTTFLPSGSGKTLNIFENQDFTLVAGRLLKASTGFDAILTLTGKTDGGNGSGLAFALHGVPRWVDSNRNSGKGRGDLSDRTIFRKGLAGTFTIHFPVMPTTPSFDLYLGLVGVHGVKGMRYLIHFSNLRLVGTPS